MAEAEAVRSKREIFGDRLKSKYPEKEYADDEALFGQINDDYDQYEQKLGGYEANEKALTEMFRKYPHSSQFIADMAAGKNPWLAMVEQLGKEGIMDIFDNPDYKDAIAKAEEEYTKRISEGEEIKKQRSTNLVESQQMRDQAQQELGLSDEETDDAMNLLMSIAFDALVGKFTRENFEMAVKAIRHDSDVDSARNEGEIAGRNAKITDKLRKSKSGDGVPMLSGSNNAPAKSGGKSIFDLAREA
jgi:hypothetical protein